VQYSHLRTPIEVVRHSIHEWVNTNKDRNRTGQLSLIISIVVSAMIGLNANLKARVPGFQIRLLQLCSHHQITVVSKSNMLIRRMRRRSGHIGSGFTLAATIVKHSVLPYNISCVTEALLLKIIRRKAFESVHVVRFFGRLLE
jgi:hypothetical protein